MKYRLAPISAPPSSISIINLFRLVNKSLFGLSCSYFPLYDSRVKVIHVSGDFTKCRAIIEYVKGTTALSGIRRIGGILRNHTPALYRSLTNLSLAVIRILLLPSSFRTRRSSVALCKRATLLKQKHFRQARKLFFLGSQKCSLRAFLAATRVASPSYTLPIFCQ